MCITKYSTKTVKVQNRNLNKNTDDRFIRDASRITNFPLGCEKGHISAHCCISETWRVIHYHKLLYCSDLDSIVILSCTFASISTCFLVGRVIVGSKDLESVEQVEMGIKN